jgi:UPF0755 protein
MRFLSGLLTLFLVVMLGAGALGALLYHQFEVPGPLNVSRVVTIPKGEGRIEIASRLEREGVISNRWTFIANFLARSLRSQTVSSRRATTRSKNASMANVMELRRRGGRAVEGDHPEA